MNEAKELMVKWQEYVALDHHKDRDCHFYVELDFAYGTAVDHTVRHYGYIADEIELTGSGSDYSKTLIKAVKKAIISEKNWCDQVIEEGETGGWDKYQVAHANKWYALFGKIKV